MKDTANFLGAGDLLYLDGGGGVDWRHKLVKTQPTAHLKWVCFMTCTLQFNKVNSIFFSTSSRIKS